MAHRSSPRPLWTGQISFGLVSIPVGLYSAVESSERISFHFLHRKDMAPIKYKKFCSVEDVEVDNDEIVRGRKVAKNRWAVVEKPELEKAARDAAPEAGRDAIEVLQFVPLDAIDPLSIDEPYYLAPRKGGEKAYGVLRDALADRRRAGIVRLALRERPHLAALFPSSKTLALVTLRPFEERREPGSLSVPPATRRPAEVKLAEVLIDRLSAQGWDPSAHPDAYRRALEKLLASKKPRAARGAADATAVEEGGEGKVVDLMEALRRSVERGGGRRAAGRRSTRRAGAA
jgi:DNA end-binding protein Ku